MMKSIRQPVPTGDAVARYERLSHEGSVWRDLSPTPSDGTDGTIGAAPAWPHFNGESYVSFGQPSKLDFSGACTVVVWYNQDTITPPVQGNERILSRDNGALRSFLIAQADNTGVCQLFAWTPTIRNIVATGTYATDTWHCVVMVNEGVGGDLVIYVDGQQRGSIAGAGGAVAAPAVDTEAGRHQIPGNTTDYFQGYIDTVRFYDRALSADEIQRDYFAGVPAHP